jgi:hypothetical protein
MGKSRHWELARFILAGVVPVLFLFTALAPARATSLAAASVTISQTCTPDGGPYTPAGSVPPGTVIHCELLIHLPQGSLSGMTLIDVVSNGGHATDTPIAFGTPAIDQYNRQEYRIVLASFCPPGCTASLPFDVTMPSTLGCYRTINNGVSLDQSGVAGHLAVASTTFSVNCHATPA